MSKKRKHVDRTALLLSKLHDVTYNVALKAYIKAEKDGKVASQFISFDKQRLQSA